MTKDEAKLFWLHPEIDIHNRMMAKLVTTWPGPHWRIVTWTPKGVRRDNAKDMFNFDRMWSKFKRLKARGLRVKMCRINQVATIIEI